MSYLNRFTIRFLYHPLFHHHLLLHTFLLHSLFSSSSWSTIFSNILDPPYRLHISSASTQSLLFTSSQLSLIRMGWHWLSCHAILIKLLWRKLNQSKYLRATSTGSLQLDSVSWKEQITWIVNNKKYDRRRFRIYRKNGYVTHSFENPEHDTTYERMERTVYPKSWKVSLIKRTKCCFQLLQFLFINLFLLLNEGWHSLGHSLYFLSFVEHFKKKTEHVLYFTKYQIYQN